ncbi:NTP transferase domain-containing protein [Pedobacter sp. GSP4]|uniref:NTP transferase domain-containing protein n=1 Tax=Pedobacter sp. GSP4 TaxID=3453716 RepID=UPI003EE9756F
MLGVILCGGQSLRMGADKGLLSHQNKLWAQIAQHKLLSLHIPVKFSVNHAQRESYGNYFDQEELIVDQAALAVKGPLLGVLSAHLTNPHEDLFLLACDLLLMENRLLEKLFEAYKSTTHFDTYIFTKSGQEEPLCGIYTANGLKKITHISETTGLAKHSMKFILGQLKVCQIAVEDQDYRSFENFNSHAEINGL